MPSSGLMPELLLRLTQEYRESIAKRAKEQLEKCKVGLARLGSQAPAMVIAIL